MLLEGFGISQVGIDWVRRVWARRRRDLEAGSSVTAGRHRLAPVPARDVQCLLYLEADVVDESILAELIGGLAEAIGRWDVADDELPQGALDRYLIETPPEEVERRRLELLLDRHEWNLSQVARLLNVTRRTIYLWLERYGIERRRVPKAIR